MLLKTLLTNFNKMLNKRGIRIPEYDQLLTMSNESLIEKLTKDLADFPTDLKALSGGEHYTLALTKVVDTEPSIHKASGKEVKLVIMWDSLSGKTMTSAEIDKIITFSGKKDIDKMIVMSIYDRGPRVAVKKAFNKSMEFFTYKDFTVDYESQFWTPVNSQLLTNEEFLEENPDMESVNIPNVNFDDPQVKYLGGRIGQVIKSENEVLLPMVLLPSTISYRRINAMESEDKAPFDGSFYGLKVFGQH